MGRSRTFDDLGDIFWRYVRQETLQPLRSLGRYLLFGIAGSLLIGLGTVLLAVGVLRGLQVLGALNGWWSWVPYMAATLPLVLTATAAVRLISRSD